MGAAVGFSVVLGRSSIGETRAALRTEPGTSPGQNGLRQTFLGLVVSATHVSLKSQGWCSHMMASLPGHLRSQCILLALREWQALPGPDT